MLTFWKKYYVEPVAYAADYTRWSRNFLNLGIGAVVVSLVFFSYPTAIRFAFSDFTGEDIQRFERVEGEYLFIGGRNSLHSGIVVPGTKQYLAYLAISVPVRTDIDTKHKPAFAHVYPGIGIVQMEIGGLTVVTVQETQAHFRRRSYWFLGFLTVAALMFIQSIVRQIDLVTHRGET